MQHIKLTDYTYDLPNERIAKFPLTKRDESKLMVYQQGKIAHSVFKNITDYLPKNSLLVFNNTKVIPARIHFQKPTGAVIQIFLLHPVAPTSVINLAMEVTNSCVWECMIGNRKRWKKSDILSQIIQVENQDIEVKAEIEDEEKNHVKLLWKVVSRKSKVVSDETNDKLESEPTLTTYDLRHTTQITFVDLIQALGTIPLPPYLNRETEASDSETYQTVYSEKKGAVAAPTAGLHFTEEVLQSLEIQGFKQDFLTLHVGAGTFQPIKVENIVEHKMHNEQVVFTKKNIETLLENLGNTIPVGTTSMRTLESIYWYGVKFLKGDNSPLLIEKLYPYEHENLPSVEESLKAILLKMNELKIEEITAETEIFIFPGYQFKVCKGIITNYHQPESTLILLIAALIGEDWRKVYHEAMTNDYRFLSYGDSSLLLL
ncbi:MAG: S-adenosylmethionine:tRNA ribosyltransferase-isomerase [Arcicella sp.]|nr:S-adenosylmethionine:tRNA ribosyltransferase-isomerase [Arcicella sp.]